MDRKSRLISKQEDAVKHAHHDNGGAAGDWKALSIRPPLRGAVALLILGIPGEFIH